MKKIIFISILLLLFSSIMVFASFYLPTEERPENWNGHHWQEMNEEQKVYFVAGICAAGNQVADLLSSFDEEEEEEEEDEEQEYVEMEDVNKIVEFADDFYEDEENRDIPLISDEITGKF
ncbi:MAG: hypothetical protein ACOC1K_00980 [Nanoarchaeota archaeon]